MEDNGKINLDRLRPYASDVSKLASSVEQVIKTDGWQIFLALWEIEKREIYHKNDYPTIQDFKADRKAIELFESITERFTGYMADAMEADVLLKTLTSDSQTPNKHVLMIDSLEEHGREQG